MVGLMNFEILKDALKKEYLDYFNNYLTFEKYAEHRGINLQKAIYILDLGRDFHEEYVKELNERSISCK